MNTDRIKSLAGQAYVQACLELQQADPAQWYSDRGPPSELVDQKFAELIIRECAQQAAQMRHVYPHQAELTATTILDHFGVKP
jgi:hypothetical protein